tara:strand:- start:251 stop:1216 length:966 start_codon:yes stop_codon:yes gene_type:complete
MFNYKNAPYIELKDYAAPKGIKSIYVPMNDNKKIRLAYWRHSSKIHACRGTILLQQGHNEFIEKYYETVQELVDRNFNVICFDWRGQGMSDRMTNNMNKQYIEDFSIHNEDINFIIKNIIKENFQEPLIGIGHSMGGHILLSSQELFNNELKGLILSAPMLGFKNENLLFLLVGIMNFFNNREKYFPGSKPNMGKETPFEQNDLTSDYSRYTRTQKLVRKHPNLRLWGVTNSWVKAVKENLLRIRKDGWAENIETRILILNPLKDKVVDSNKTITMAKKLPNCDIINIENVEHEILMEKDKYRKIFWNSFDNFLDSLINEI